MARFPALRHVLLASAVLVVLPLSASADKKQPAVTGSWRGAPASVPVGEEFDLILRVEATQDAPTLTVEIPQSPGIEIVSGATTWAGSLLRGRAIDLRVTARVVQDGDWTIGAGITNYGLQGNQVSGAVLYVLAANGTAMLGGVDHQMMRIAELSLPEDLREAGIAMPDPGPPTRDFSGPAIASVVSGTARYRDPEGNLHPIRRALLQVTNAAGALLLNTSTNDAGGYSAPINADSVRVSVFTQDSDNARVIVFPPGLPAQRYLLQSALTPITAAATTINLTSETPIRGTPTVPSTDSIAARGFMVYDGIQTFWFQASGLIGRAHQQAKVLFPEPTTGPGTTCATSCYSHELQQLFIIREDAFDWDVLGHEFFHFTQHRSPARSIANNPGGPHNGGSAIGENGRNRDEGLRLAWAEGTATAMSLLLQKGPTAPFAFPAIVGINDGLYTDLEDGGTRDNPETPPTSDGFASENSVLGVIWDLSDTVQDSVGFVTDNFAGLNAPLLWTAMNALLPGCNPCDRVDKFWTGIVNLFGVTSPVLFDVGKIFALNNMAARTFAPVDGESVPGTAAPTFIWFENGDPALAHENNQFILVFSRDNFVSHRATIQVPLGQDRYTPTDAEWQAVQAGGRGGETYKWFVAAKRSDAPPVPQSWFWYSNVLSIAPRAIEATITWSPVGADVDLHLANPSGTDIAYYNRTTSWGFLDRDCITTCAQEIISVKSLPLRGAYRLFAHYFSDRGRGPATVRAVVRSGSQVLVDTVFTLSGTGATVNLIPPFTIDETGTATREVAVDSELDPALLPPKKRSP